MVDSKRLRRRALVVVGCFAIVFGGILAYPTIKSWPARLGPLDAYVVYDASDGETTVDSSRIGRWRSARSRLELLSRGEHEIIFPVQRFEPRTIAVYATVKLPPQVIQSQVVVSDTIVAADDLLQDFVVEHDDHFAFPNDREELQQAVQNGTANRFVGIQRIAQLSKPFYGSLPRYLIYGEQLENIERSRHGWRNFDAARPAFVSRFARMLAPDRPQVTLTSASNAIEAHELTLLNEPVLIRRPRRPFWAIVYVGKPTPYLIDRVTITPQAAEIRIVAAEAVGAAYSELVPGWVYAPLGQLPTGDYRAVVRDLETGEEIVSGSAEVKEGEANVDL
ncbi:MAG: hypothetical protein KDA61_00575 [Planctomycetales bacterium]|nr:hypothetical protein [Planctomycetales bacterium]